MAYDEALAERIREVLSARNEVTERTMFGGIAFMIGDRMALGVVRDDLMVRIGPDARDDAVRWVEAGASFAVHYHRRLGADSYGARNS